MRSRNKLLRQCGRSCFLAATVGAMLALLALPVAAQTQSLQTWPELDAYLTLNSDVRVSFFAAATRENRQGTSAEIGPNIDFYFKPLVKLKKITLFELDPSKSRLLMFRAGYRYMPSTDGPTEHRGLLEVTGNYPLVRGVLLSDRNRLDLRSIAGELAWRYRNRISAERTVSIRSYHFTPYLRAEAYYDGNFHKWSRTAETAGCIFPFRKRYEVEPYYEHQNETGTSPNRQVDALGLVLSLYF
ncbi:MAG: DUF2490 domain-containing protein [Candidatus Korobacteraceae bacterium]